VLHELALSSSVERHVLFGDPARTLLAFCDERRPGMIVLGSRGHGGLKTALLGSVSGKVARRAGCVVVIVPPGAADETSQA
jgi:nucleotide-binding universal stress UspA family protein